PEQTGEFQFILHAPAMAQAGNAAAYAAFEARPFLLTSAWGACLYAVAALFWSWCFAAAGTWRRWMTPFAITLWLFFAYISGGLLLPPALRPSFAFVAAGNAVGFVLLMLWFTVVTELVLRRSRPDGAHGREQPWRHPNRRLPGRLADLLANSRLVRAWCELLPVTPMLSDIRDVIYINYVVPAERLAALVPDGLELQRIGPDGHHALLTFLTFRHGHFGPRFLGPLRRLLPSPVQTNWRIYVRDPVTGHDGVYFVTNAIDSTVHALGARLLSEAMPMHVLKRADIRLLPDGAFQVLLDPGAGSGPAMAAQLRHGDQHPTAGPWREAFSTYTEMLTHCVPQDRALSCQPWRNRVTRQEIILEIPLDACEPLDGIVHSPAAEAIVGDAQPFCFRVPRVSFRFEREDHDLRQQSSTSTPAARSRSAS
ncbi:MAG: hypothetical protein JWN15_1656, partial [Firmicutes bacterium]|nr:hypothetical protein [Bacillota bacterium]